MVERRVLHVSPYTNATGPGVAHCTMPSRARRERPSFCSSARTPFRVVLTAPGRACDMERRSRTRGVPSSAQPGMLRIDSSRNPCAMCCRSTRSICAALVLSGRKAPTISRSVRLRSDVSRATSNSGCAAFVLLYALVSLESIRLARIALVGKARSVGLGDLGPSPVDEQLGARQRRPIQLIRERVAALIASRATKAGALYGQRCRPNPKQVLCTGLNVRSAARQ